VTCPTCELRRYPPRSARLQWPLTKAVDPGLPTLRRTSAFGLLYTFTLPLLNKPTFRLGDYPKCPLRLSTRGRAKRGKRHFADCRSPLLL
jgi:hypothetical protein